MFACSQKILFQWNTLLNIGLRKVLEGPGVILLHSIVVKDFYILNVMMFVVQNNFYWVEW